MPAPPITSTDPLRRVLAAICAVLVLTLTIFAASPTAHDWLHVDNVPLPADDSCAVVLFAAGVSLPLAPITAPVPVESPNAISATAAADVFLVSPRYLRQPERGPPSSRVG
jgi:hypothetical protein